MNEQSDVTGWRDGVLTKAKRPKNLMVVALICFGLGAAVTWFANAVNFDFSTARQVSVLMDVYHGALLDRDREKLGSVLADEVLLETQFERTKFTRQRFIERALGTHRVHSIVTHKPIVSVDESQAVITLTQTLRLDSSDSPNVEHWGKYSYTFRYLEGSWRIVGVRQETVP